MALSWGNWGQSNSDSISLSVDPGSVRTNQAPPPRAAFGQGAWYDTPGLRFNPQNPFQAWDRDVGAYQGLQVPEWMTDPPTFYGVYQSAPENYRSAVIGNERSRMEAQARTLAGQSAGRTALQNQARDVNQAAASWADDPGRARALDEMMRRTSPDYSFFSPTERTAVTQPVGQAYARQNAQMQAEQAGRGTWGGGGAIEDSSALRVLADAQGTQLRAQIDAQEKELKNQALATLAGTTAAYNAADTAYLNAGNQLAGALAALEAGLDFEPTDYTVWPALSEAQSRAEDEATFRDEALRQMEEESKFNFQDLAELFLSGQGSGAVPQAIGGTLGALQLLAA
jgi:hypothetical protein